MVDGVHGARMRMLGEADGDGMCGCAGCTPQLLPCKRCVSGRHRHSPLTSPAVPVPQWQIKNFSTLRSEVVRSDCFEAGICTWWVGGGTQAMHVRNACADWSCVALGLAAGG
jgi:hypothetical protein